MLKNLQCLEDSAKLGCCVWIVVLGWFGMAHTTTSSMSRFNMHHKVGYTKPVKRILKYLMTFLRGRIIINTQPWIIDKKSVCLFM
jgi:hypothetical protein